MPLISILSVRGLRCTFVFLLFFVCLFVLFYFVFSMLYSVLCVQRSPCCISSQTVFFHCCTHSFTRTTVSMPHMQPNSNGQRNTLIIYIRKSCSSKRVSCSGLSALHCTSKTARHELISVLNCLGISRPLHRTQASDTAINNYGCYCENKSQVK